MQVAKPEYIKKKKKYNFYLKGYKLKFSFI